MKVATFWERGLHFIPSSWTFLEISPATPARTKVSKGKLDRNEATMKEAPTNTPLTTTTGRTPTLSASGEARGPFDILPNKSTTYMWEFKISDSFVVTLHVVLILSPITSLRDSEKDRLLDSNCILYEKKKPIIFFFSI